MDFLSEIDHLASTLAFFGMLLVAAKWITKRLAPKKADPFFSKLHKPVGYLTAIAGITRKKDLLLAMSGHVLQTGEIIGWYQPCKTGKNERKNEMKKQFFIPACVLAAAAIGFAIYAAGHPEMSFSWSIQITHILYGLYVDAVVLLFVLAFWKNATCLNVLTLLLELGAVFFLVQSILTVFPEGKPNWYLPLALGLNCVALFLNAVQRRKQQRKEKAKE